MLQTSARRLVVPGLVVVLALLAAGCSEEESAAPEPEPTPLASLNTSAMEVPRIEFCQLVPDTAVEEALGGKPDTDTSYGNGDQVALPGEGPGESREVVHELGCAWSTEEGAAVRAWVFARPVDRAFARKVVASTRRTGGCRVGLGPAYGDPSVTQTCRLSEGARRVRHAGLFGQTWLSCEVSDPRGALPAIRTRADQWCVAVVNALDTGG